MLNVLVIQTLLTIKVMWVKRYSSYSFFRYKFKLVDSFRMRLLIAQGFFWIVRILSVRFQELLTELGLFLHLMCYDFDQKMSGLKAGVNLQSGVLRCYIRFINQIRCNWKQ